MIFGLSAAELLVMLVPIVSIILQEFKFGIGICRSKEAKIDFQWGRGHDRRKILHLTGKPADNADTDEQPIQILPGFGERGL